MDVPFAVSEIIGPIAVQEAATAYYDVVSTCGKGVIYAWSCEPESAGAFNPDDRAVVAFNAASVDEDTSVEISVMVSVEGVDSITRTKTLTVRNVIP